MALDLRSPLVITDTETTGVVPRIDHIVQVGIVKLRPVPCPEHHDGCQCVLSVERSEWSTLVRPPIPIPPEATDVHHITDDMVKDAPTFAELAPKLAAGFKFCDFCGYNVDFDLAMYEIEFQRAGLRDVLQGRKVDPNKIYHGKMRRTLVAAAEEFLGEKFEEGAHDALRDTLMTERVLYAMLERWPDLPRDVAGLHKLFFETPAKDRIDAGGAFYWRYREATFAFGKHQGTTLREVRNSDLSYLKWILGSNFDPQVKAIVKTALTGQYPVWTPPEVSGGAV